MKVLKFFAFTCLFGVALAIPDSGQGLGRAHIYHAGDYGSCFSYQATAKDANGPCGSSPSDPCISTSRQDAGEDCGKCFKVTNVDLGTTTYLYIVDTDGSDATFEMTLPAWEHLCPQICQGYGVCEAASKKCEFGNLDVWTAQGATVRWERYECGSNGNGGNDNNNGNNNGNNDNNNGNSNGNNDSNNTDNGNSNNNNNNGNGNSNNNNGSNDDGDSFIVNGKTCCIAADYKDVPGMKGWCIDMGCPDGDTCHLCSGNNNGNTNNNDNNNNNNNNSNNNENNNSNNNGNNNNNNSSNNSNGGSDEGSFNVNGKTCCIYEEFRQQPDIKQWCINMGCSTAGGICYECGSGSNNNENIHGQQWFNANGKRCCLTDQWKGNSAMRQWCIDNSCTTSGGYCQEC